MTPTRTSWLPRSSTPDRDERAADGALGELTLTALGRAGFPAVRYRNGDVVQSTRARCPARHAGLWPPEGILGRTDDMVVIRGMNVYPSAIERELREMGEIGEFRITFYTEPAGSSMCCSRAWSR